MPKERFVFTRFGPSAGATVQIVDGILDEYRALGYDLSLRQLYYQMVARGYLENSVPSYKQFGALVNRARLGGYLDWDMIKDRGRETIVPPSWDSPADLIDAAAAAFRVDKWADQPEYVEVFVEKEALEGVLEPVCRNELAVRFTANKGYGSSTLFYETGKRLEDRLANHDAVILIYLGDHDPSGLDMVRDVRERCNLFAYADGALIVEHVALRMDQVNALNPPENPAKMSDSRAAKYVARYGTSSWELDAIEPTALAQLVRDAVNAHRDDTLWAAAVAREEALRADLATMAREYRERSSA